jgi:hypothetical protein
VLNGVLFVIRQGFAHRGAWKKITPSIQWNGTKIVKLNILYRTDKILASKCK